MTRRVTVLGSCGAWPEPGRATSGFLVELDGLRLVIDLGYGTFSRLTTLCPAAALDAVVITHEHPDHCVDLSALFRARYFSAAHSRLPLYTTPGVVARIDQLEPSGGLREAFEVYYLPGSYDLGPVRLEAMLLPHHVTNAGVRLSTGAFALAYTGDTGPTEALAGLGADADLFIVEATGHRQGPHLDGRYDLTSADAGEWAARAKARRLLLHHFWPGLDRSRSVAEAKATYDGDVIAAEEGLAISLT